MFSQSTRIGPYFLIRKLGQGGFGEVWLSERRAKFVTTRVAIKLPHDEQVDHEAIKSAIVSWFYMSAISSIAEDPEIAQTQAVIAIPQGRVTRPNANVAKAETSPEPSIEPKVVKTADLQKYQGKQISDITKDNEIRGRLKAILGSNYPVFMKNLNVCPPFASNGGELTGACCAPHSCGSEMSYISLDPSKDKIYCAILSDSLSANGSADAPFNTKLRTFNEKGGTFPQALAALISKDDR